MDSAEEQDEITILTQLTPILNPQSPHVPAMPCKVTVLVAVYNTARFLPRCLDSLLAQTMKDIQVVCIDDASTDDSLQLLHSYARRDKRIEVIALPENHGQAYARNRGLERACGHYVCFLDSDDWLSADALERAAEVLDANPATDCVLFQVDLIKQDAVKRYPMPPFSVLTGEEAFRLSLDWQIHGVYMVRAALHRRFPYDDTCRSYSDDNTTRLHYLHSREVRQCQGIYNYYQHPSSTSNGISVRQFDKLRASESMKKALVEAGVPDDVLRQWETTRMLVLADCYMFYHIYARRLSADERHHGLAEMRRAWQNIDTTLLNPQKTDKFGYRHMHSWTLFRLQEWAYFTLRGLIGKNRKIGIKVRKSIK